MNIKEMVSTTLNISFDFNIKEIKTGGVYVKYEHGSAIVGGNAPYALARAYMLLAKGVSEGRTSFEISQKQHFKECGIMVDMSRGRVMRISAIKKFLNYMALHGYNMFMLYTEFAYEVEGYPYMGYQNGRYSISELKEIDDYAAELGIEVIPCIQTLGHMNQFLTYGANNHMADNKEVLLVDSPETYKFIEACISTMRKAFRSDRIHIGCDETRGLGLGKYLKIHGFRNSFDVFNEHLHRVVKICNKYDYQPIMWSDMYFSLAALPGDEDYSTTIEIPQYAIDSMPDADMVFWDYYHNNNDFYRVNIEKHKKFNRNILFAGGMWAWSGFVSDYRETYNNSKPALEECLRNNIDSVLATVWGNCPEESQIHSIPSFSVYSEYFWRGLECTEDDIFSISQFVSGTTRELTDAISDFYSRLNPRYRTGQLIIYSDPLINLLCYDIDLALAEKIYKDSLIIFEKYPNAPDIEYYKAVFQAAIDKCYIHQNLRKKYKENDREWLADFAYNIIPDIKRDFEKLYKLLDEIWHRDCKTQGFELIAIRFAGAIERIRYTGEVIKKYLVGEIAVIEALEPEIMTGKKEIAVGVKRVMQSFLEMK